MGMTLSVEPNEAYVREVYGITEHCAYTEPGNLEYPCYYQHTSASSYSVNTLSSSQELEPRSIANYLAEIETQWLTPVKSFCLLKQWCGNRVF